MSKNGILADDFDIILLPHGYIRFANLKGHKILLSFYGHHYCPVCRSRYYERAGLNAEVKDKLFMVAVFCGERVNYNEALGNGSGIINLFDPLGKVYELYWINHPFKAKDTKQSAISNCKYPADFLIDEEFNISESASMPQQEYGLPLAEIINFAII